MAPAPRSHIGPHPFPPFSLLAIGLDSRSSSAREDTKGMLVLTFLVKLWTFGGGAPKSCRASFTSMLFAPCLPDLRSLRRSARQDACARGRQCQTSSPRQSGLPQP